MATPALIPGRALRTASVRARGAQTFRTRRPLTDEALKPLPPSRFTPDDKERERWVIKLLPLVKQMAFQVRERLPMHIELDDLISTGVLGLVDAVRKFDARKQTKVESYARHRIRGAILDGLRALDCASRDMRKKNKQAEVIYQELERRLGRCPTDTEMAEAMGMGLAQWYRTVRELQSVGIDWLRPMASVTAQESRASQEEASLSDDPGRQFEMCYHREQKGLVQSALNQLPRRERQVMLLYYEQEQTMKEIGLKLGIDESRVSQIHSAALVRLRARVGKMLDRPEPCPPRLSW